ncbi:MAG: hypothetical protein ACI9T9_002064, partial [Oleiphilaceae bacterium]
LNKIYRLGKQGLELAMPDRCFRSSNAIPA